jgi:hypothetical protein
MKATITNTSRAMQGVYSVSGLVFIEAGATKPVDVADDYVERVKALPFLDAEWGDPLDHDDNGTKGGTKPNATPSERDVLKARAAELKLDFAGNIKTDKLKDLVAEAEAKKFDDMSDTELKTFLWTKGVTTTDETRDQLIELAKAA